MISGNWCSWSPSGTCCGYPVQFWQAVEEVLWALEQKPHLDQLSLLRLCLLSAVPTHVLEGFTDTDTACTLNFLREIQVGTGNLLFTPCSISHSKTGAGAWGPDRRATWVIYLWCSVSPCSAHPGSVGLHHFYGPSSLFSNDEVLCATWMYFLVP